MLNWKEEAIAECLRLQDQRFALQDLRKLKDVDMIEDTVAYYDEHQNVIIKEVR